MRWLVAAVVFGIVASAAAEPGVIVISVEAGKTVKRPVGSANGWRCDVPNVIKARVVSETTTNLWVVEGRSVGRAQCVVGTDPLGESFIFDVFVTAPTKPAKPAKKPRR